MARKVGVVVAVVVCCASAGGAVADAATPFTAGAGGRISLAVGPDGVGHLAWRTAAVPEQVGYCRIVVNRCDPAPQALTFPGVGPAGGGTQVQVFALETAAWSCSPGARRAAPTARRTAKCDGCPATTG